MLTVLLGLASAACQYSTGEALRKQAPEYKDLVAVVNGPDVEIRQGQKKLQVNSKLDEVGCRMLCDKDTSCIGFVIRAEKANPKRKTSEKTNQVNCWMIPRGAPRSAGLQIRGSKC